MNIKKTIAGALSLCIAGGILIGLKPVLPEFSASAVSDVNYTKETYGDLTYKKYSDHIEIYKCVRSAVEVDIPEKIDGLPVTAIGKHAFFRCASLSSVNIPDSVTIIEENAFTDCTSLSSVNIPDNVTKIGAYAFAFCTSLTSVKIPDGVKVIEGCSFAGSGLKSIVIPDSVEIIEYSAFEHCYDLASVNISENVKSIYHSTFSDCTSLTSIIIPKSVTSLGKSIFYGCTNLSSIIIKNPDCDIEYLWSSYENEKVEFKGTIYGHENSTAQKYAQKYGYKFRIIGDLDGDGAINALDASLVLMEYAAKATGKDSVLTNEQKLFADINNDGNIDALDASDILRYYSFTATGGVGSIEEYLNK